METNETTQARLKACKEELNKVGFTARDWDGERLAVSCESLNKNADEDSVEFEEVLNKYGCEAEPEDAGTMIVWAEESLE